MDKFEVILCIVNSGFAELVMDTAKQFGQSRHSGAV